MKNIPGMGNIPGMNGFMSGDMNDNISQKQKIKKKNNEYEIFKLENVVLCVMHGTDTSIGGLF